MTRKQSSARWRILATVVAVIGLAIGTGLPVAADVGEGNGEVGFDFGFTNLDSNTSNDAGVCGGIRGGYHFTRLFELEGQVTNMTATDWASFDFNGQDITMTTILVNAVFNFHPKENVVPYVLAGAGRVVSDVDLGRLDLIGVDDSGSALQLAVGSRFFFGSGKRAAFRIEASLLRENTFDENSTHTSVVGGFTWRIGAS